VKTTAELDAALAQAASSGKPAMLDFYADWCVSCKEMEKLTFTDPRVREQFAGMVLLQADVTANNADDKALLKRFRLFGPPGILFFGSDGVEVQGARVVGYQDADRFLKALAVVRR
jgi:thioredoxin:protein disulfide reductase